MRSFFLCIILLAASITAIDNPGEGSSNTEAASTTEEQRLVRLGQNANRVHEPRPNDFKKDGEGNIIPSDEGLSTFKTEALGTLEFT
jgi:hypothetical protein